MSLGQAIIAQARPQMVMDRAKDVICRAITVIADGGIPFHFRTTFFRPLLAERDMECLNEFQQKWRIHQLIVVRHLFYTCTVFATTDNSSELSRIFLFILVHMP